MSSPLIDWHNHWFSPRVVDLLSRRARAPRITANERGEKFLVSSDQAKGASLPPLPIALGFLSVDERLRHLDEVGVEQQVISWPTTLGADAILTAGEARPIWQAYNEDLSALVENRPDRFIGLAVLPTSDIDWAARELERAHRELGLIGAVLPVGAFFSREGADALAPIFEIAQQHGSHIYLHTGPAAPSISGQLRFPEHREGDSEGRSRWLLDAYTQFAGGVLTLALTDYLDPYPDVTVQVAMLGGAVSFLAEGLENFAKSGLAPVAGKAADPRASLRRLYVDTGVVGRGVRALELAVEVFGADRVLFGSDYPLIGIGPALEAVRRADLSDHERKRILSENGVELLAARRRDKAAAARV